MRRQVVTVYEAAGSSYEVGYALGLRFKQVPELAAMARCRKDAYTTERFARMKELLDAWCPGLNDEIRGCADALGVPQDDMAFYGMACLAPGCSVLAVLPSLTADGHVMAASNYEFSPLMEDFTFCRTKVTGKYAHIGSVSMLFGRGEGLNERGLMVAQSSCGFPVGAEANMRQPAIEGLQFCAAIRALLENCADIDEALAMLSRMPIAFNINLILADKSGRAALYETLDGQTEYRVIDASSADQYLHSTNHAHLPGLRAREPKALEHSVTRYEYIQRFMTRHDSLTVNHLKGLLLSMYPEGLCCHWYDAFFGTLKSMVFDVTQGTVSILWGGTERNGWQTWSFDMDMKPETFTIEMDDDAPACDIGRYIDCRERQP